MFTASLDATPFATTSAGTTATATATSPRTVYRLMAAALGIRVGGEGQGVERRCKRAGAAVRSGFVGLINTPGSGSLEGLSAGVEMGGRWRREAEV